MSEQTLTFIDRLQERGFIDRWGFTTFAAFGAIAIVGAKFLGAPVWATPCAAILLILSYAVIINFKGTGKLRSDQAGDNCYYLGLIYTLTSLAYAIFTFDPDDTATTIVQGFGIALASTIVGLVLRVFFNQSRVDLYETEDTARLELAQAAAKLKGELSQISLEFKEFAVGLQQGIAEVRAEAIESVKQTSIQAVEVVRGLATEVRTTLETQSTELTAHGKKVATNTASVAEALARHKAAIDGLSDAYDEIAEGIDDMAEAAANMAKHSAEIEGHTRVTREQQVDALTATASLSSAADQVSRSVNAALEKTQRWEIEFAQRLAELENGPKQNADMALKAIAKAAEAVGDAMTRLSAVQEQAIGSVATSTDGLLTVVKGHNAALESELDKSRGHVRAVHSALVDMTGKLANSMGSDDHGAA